MLIKLCQLSKEGQQNQRDSERHERENMRRNEVYRWEENLRREQLLEEDVRRTFRDSQPRNNEIRSFVVDEIIENLHQQGEQTRPSAPSFNSRIRSNHNRLNEQPSAPVLVHQTSSQPLNPTRIVPRNVNDDLPPSYYEIPTNANDSLPPSYHECFQSS
jgi:hypothetical protein